MISFKGKDGLNLDYNFKDNSEKRKGFNDLALETYGFSFEDWYQKGYWSDQYIPYALWDGNLCVANISVNPMKIQIHGQVRNWIQLGTVMTQKAYRNRGLSRVLMEHILEEWKPKCDLIYLFANNSVLDFYPKFGFEAITQYQAVRKLDLTEQVAKNELEKNELEKNELEKNVSDREKIFEKLNMSQNKNREMAYEIARKSVHHGYLSMKGNGELIMFYLISFLAEQVYYDKEENALILVEFEGEKLHIMDIFCDHPLNLAKISDQLVCFFEKNQLDKKEDTIKIQQIAYGFTPRENEELQVSNEDSRIACVNLEHHLLQEDTLFAIGDNLDLLKKDQFMFPLLSHA